MDNSGREHWKYFYQQLKATQLKLQLVLILLKPRVGSTHPSTEIFWKSDF